jgi:hypothetical protein
MQGSFNFMPLGQYQTQVYHHGKTHKDTVVFNDEKLFHNHQGHKIHQVTIFHDGKYVYGFRLHFIMLANGQHVKGQRHLPHNRPSNLQKTKLKLDQDEYITTIFGRNGDIMDNLGFKTSKGKQIHGGGHGGQGFELHAPSGTHFAAIWGGMGGHIHNISASTQPFPTIFKQETISYGKTHNDTKFFNDAQTLNGTNGHHKVSKISIFHDKKYVFGLQFEYSASNNGLLYTYQGGQHVGNQAHTLQKDTLVLDANEYLVECYGKSGDIFDHIGFRTSTGRKIDGGGHGGNAFDIKAPHGMHFNTLGGGLGGHLHNISMTASSIPHHINWSNVTITTNQNIYSNY